MSRKTVSAIVLTLLLISMLALAFNIQPAKAEGTIYIMADGSIEGTEHIRTVDNVTYFLDANIEGYVEIRRNNIIVDGHGYMLQGFFGTTGGVNLPGRTNITIQNLNVYNFWYGIYLSNSSNVIITRCNITASWSFAITLEMSSTDNVIFNTNLVGNSGGIGLFSASNSVFKNTITSSVGNAVVIVSDDNRISENNITANGMWGVWLDSCSGNVVSGNDISANSIGIKAQSASNNKIYHNNFKENTQQINIALGVLDIWDQGHPSGGNYWSDYAGTDLYSGSYQNDTGSDGIGDSLCTINANNKDNYPLMHPYGSIQNLNTSLVYLTIQSAIDAPETEDGHTIFVRSGTYCENIMIDKRISMLGQSREGTVIDGNYTGNTVYINASNVDITELLLCKGLNSLTLHYCNNTSIHNVKFSENWGSVVIDNCWFTNFSDNWVENPVGHGILLKESFNSTIANSSIAKQGGYGIYLFFSSNNTIEGNAISDQPEIGGADIKLEHSMSNLFKNNTLSECRLGLSMETSAYNRIFHNNFLNNSDQISLYSSPDNLWDNGCEGDYWSDYNGTDLYHGPYQNETGSDGIGDAPYVIDANNRDSYPLMKAFPWSEHDIGITYIGRIYSFDLVVPLKTIVGLRFSPNISTFVMNYGSQTESFNVQVYANDTLVGTFANVTLAARQSAILNLRWNTTGFAYGNYGIRAVADNLAGETDVSDNGYADGIVYVGMPGDVNGDGKVNIKDIAYVARRFGTNPRDSIWEPNADLNDDEKIDILDVSNAARHFGEHL